MAMDLIRVPVKNPVGVIKDPNPSDLPLTTWDDVRNVRFHNGKTYKSQGHEQVFPNPPANPLYLMPYLSQNVPYWFSASAGKLHRTEGTTWADVSRPTGGAYGASLDRNWNGGFLNQVAIMNNSFDIPQSMQPTGSTFVDLPNWPAAYRAKIIRPFKNYLVALNITNNSVDQPTTVKWSSPADPGEVPFTWDVNDATNDAGESFLADTPGAIVDGKKLKDSFIIYKEDSVYAMRYIGGVFIFQFQQLFDDIGMIAPNCVAEFDGKHFVVGQGDVYVHNGVQKSSVIDGKMKSYLYDSFKQGGGGTNTFVVPDYNNTEMWICYQRGSSQSSIPYANQALIWNWRSDTWTIRDLPEVTFGTHGIVDPQKSDAWDDDNQTWDTDTTVWGSASYNPSKTKLVFSSPPDNAIYTVGDVSEFAGKPFFSYMEKTNISLDDDLNLKNITGITPHITGSGEAKIYIGSNNLSDGAVTWQGPYTYRIGQDFKVDCRVNGRYFGVRFEFSSVGTWTLNGYTFEMTKPIGKR